MKTLTMKLSTKLLQIHSSNNFGNTLDKQYHEKAKILEDALEKISIWFDEFPDTHEFYDDGTPVSFKIQFGSNGERDFMRNIAKSALEQTTFKD